MQDSGKQHRQSPILRLIVGRAEADFMEHPTAALKRAAETAADHEKLTDPRLADQIRRFARALPDRPAPVRARDAEPLAGEHQDVR